VRVGFPGGPRLEYYDRNPQEVSITFGAADIAPHATTTRATYTVPTGKKAMVMSGYSEMLRKTAATAVGNSYAIIKRAALYLIGLFMRKNTVGDQVNEAIGINAMLLAGQALELVTSDASTAGTIDYEIDAHIIEFNA